MKKQFIKKIKIIIEYWEWEKFELDWKDQKQIEKIIKSLK